MKVKTMPKVIIYGSNSDRKKVASLIENEEISITSTGGSTYQQERNFVYGNSEYGHAVAVICISEENPIPFGVLSADIIKKQLPIVLFVKNNEKSQNLFNDFSQFLENTNEKIYGNYQVNSFCFKSANIIKVNEQASENNSSIDLIEAIEETYSKYINQKQDNRTVRQESVKPNHNHLMDKRDLFGKKGLGETAHSLEMFQNNLNPDLQTISFFGVSCTPKTDICKWGSELKNFNLIYGLMGEDKNKSFEQQSMMYQFVWHAAQNNCRIFGTIPFEQTKWEEQRDFSELNIHTFYITENLDARIEAFAKPSDLIIVGSCGTGTYEEVLDILRIDPKRPIVIINDDESNTPLIQYLNNYKQLYTNIFAINNQEKFKEFISDFSKNYCLSKKESLVNEFEYSI
jgi:hypothetical protein